LLLLLNKPGLASYTSSVMLLHMFQHKTSRNNWHKFLWAERLKDMYWETEQHKTQHRIQTLLLTLMIGPSYSVVNVLAVPSSCPECTQSNSAHSSYNTQPCSDKPVLHSLSPLQPRFNLPGGMIPPQFSVQKWYINWELLAATCIPPSTQLTTTVLWQANWQREPLHVMRRTTAKLQFNYNPVEELIDTLQQLGT